MTTVMLDSFHAVNAHFNNKISLPGTHLSWSFSESRSVGYEKMSRAKKTVVLIIELDAIFWACEPIVRKQNPDSRGLYIPAGGVKFG